MLPDYNDKASEKSGTFLFIFYKIDNCADFHKLNYQKSRNFLRSHETFATALTKFILCKNSSQSRLIVLAIEK